MVRDKILEAFKYIAEDMVKLWNVTLSKYDIEKGDNIETKIEFPSIEFIYPNYFEYVENGRRPKAKRVPIDALIEWAKKHNIPTDNSTLFAIQESIYKNGIRQKPVFLDFSKELDDSWDVWAEQIFNKLSEAFEEIWQSL